MKYIYVIEEEGGDGEAAHPRPPDDDRGRQPGSPGGEMGPGYSNCDRLQPEEGTGC